jgi:hypothetical protein
MGGALSQIFWPVPVMLEMIRVFPDALFWGVGIIAMATLSFSFSIFFASLLEGVAIYHLIKIVNNHLGIVETSRKTGAPDRTCKLGLGGVSSLSVMQGFEPHKIPFPSSHTFILSFIATYILSVIITFKDELDILGPTYGESYTSRIYFSTAAFTIMMFLAMTYRLFFECDSFSVILISFILGTLGAALVVQQNLLLFGLDSLNLLGVPILRKRTADGDDLLVCSSSTT